MKLTRTNPPAPGTRKVVSRTDAILLMIATAAAAAMTTVLTVSGIIRSFNEPVTLTLPVATSHLTATGLDLGARGHYTALEATIPSLPSGPGALLSWGTAMNQVGILAVLALVFLLALRLRGENLFEGLV